MDSNNMNNSNMDNGNMNGYNTDNNVYGNNTDNSMYQNGAGTENMGSYQNPNYQPYQNNYYNGNYQMPYQQEPQLDLEEPVKMSEWLISFLIMMIPCAGIIMPFVWAFSRTEKKSKSNFFKAYLIMLGIVFALYLLLVIFIAVIGVSLSTSSW